MTTRRLTAVLALSLAALSAAGCAGYSMKRVNPSADDDVGGTGIDSADVIAATDRADYFVLSFRLVDLSGAVRWSNQYEFKKVGDAGVIYQ